MNHEMMLYQTRQDFIDLFLALSQGQAYSLQHIERIVRDLKGMDDINFEYLLDYVQQTERVNIRQIWQEIERLIDASKHADEWERRKQDKVSWENGRLIVLGP
jgi:hypothetical protein